MVKIQKNRPFTSLFLLQNRARMSGGKQKEGARVKMGASAQTPIAYICSNVGRRIGCHEKTRYSIGPDMEFGAIWAWSWSWS